MGADCPPGVAVDGDAGGLGGALPAADRVLGGGPEVLEPTVGLGVGVVAPELDAEGVTVTVVMSVVVPVSGGVLPPMIVSPESPPDSGPPLSFSTSVTVAMLPAKITTAAAAPASTTVSGRRDRLGASATGKAGRAMITVGSSFGWGVPGGNGCRTGTAAVAAGVPRVVSAGRTRRNAFVMWRRVANRERP